MGQRGWARLCTRLALWWLLAAGCAAATAQAPAPDTWVVAPGQSATEIALDQVPPGTTMDQFLLALFKLNPQAFQEASLDRLLAGARLRLPSAEEANAMPVALARAELGRLQQGLPAPATPEAEPAPPPAAALPVQAEPPQAEPARQAGPEGGPSSQAQGLAAAALLVLLALAWWHRSQPVTSPPSKPAEDGPTDEQERQAQGRFQPVLPDDTPPSPKGPASHGAQAKPALFDLDLSLDGPAPPLDLPRPARARPPMAADSAAFDLGALSLDLGHAAPTKASAPGPLDLSGLSLDLEPPGKPSGTSSKDAA